MLTVSCVQVCMRAGVRVCVGGMCMCACIGAARARGRCVCMYTVCACVYAVCQKKMRARRRASGAGEREGLAPVPRSVLLASGNFDFVLLETPSNPRNIIGSKFI
jgi:hypothetical protein